MTRRTTTEPGALEALAEVLDLQRAHAVVDHRKALRKPLTAYAAQLLAKQFALCADPGAAADAMILNGWQGFRPEWLQPAASRPGSQQRPRGVAAMRSQLEQEISDGHYGPVEGFGGTEGDHHHAGRGLPDLFGKRH